MLQFAYLSLIEYEWISLTFLFIHSLSWRGRLVEPLVCGWEKKLDQWGAPMEEVSLLLLVGNLLLSPPEHTLVTGPTHALAPPSCLLKLTSIMKLTGVSRVLETLRPSLWLQSSNFWGVMWFVYECVLISRLLWNCT